MMDKIRHYENGSWSETDDRLSRAIEVLPDDSVDLEALHLSQVMRLGYGDGAALTLWGHSARWPGPVDLPAFTIEIYGDDETSELVTVATITDAMDLMGRWAPAITAALLSRKAGYRP